jgi:hypothetical protein
MSYKWQRVPGDEPGRRVAFSVRAAEDGHYIILKLVGTSGRPEFQGVLEAHALGARLGIHRYLVDLTDAHNADRTMDDYALAYDDFPHSPTIDRFAKVVALAKPDDHSHDFLVTLFKNAGSPIQLFHDREVALQALLGGGPIVSEEADGAER